MSNRLWRLKVRNFRSLADVEVETRAINVLFGPNGAGKSTLLDALWFVRDCAVLGVDTASSIRSHGIGALWDGADAGANISIELETGLAKYSVLFGYSSGRIEPFVGETLLSKDHDTPLIDRKVGSDKANFYHTNMKQPGQFSLRDPEQLALDRYLNLEQIAPLSALELDKLLRFVSFYYSRDADFNGLKTRGSDSSHQLRLRYRCQNLWSVLRNIHDRRGIDARYDTIIDFMRESFPNFRNLLIEQIGPNAVYGNFIERKLRNPIPASGVSDGHLQMLILLTALFSEGKDHEELILFDEPEISLHPYALAVFARAVMAAKEWNKQVFIATHSPVLMSQFDLENILAVGLDESGQTVIQRVSEMDDIQDLLDKYALGSLYMAEAVAPQSKLVTEESAGD